MSFVCICVIQIVYTTFKFQKPLFLKLVIKQKKNTLLFRSTNIQTIDCLLTTLKKYVFFLLVSFVELYNYPE